MDFLLSKVTNPKPTPHPTNTLHLAWNKTPYMKVLHVDEYGVLFYHLVQIFSIYENTACWWVGRLFLSSETKLLTTWKYCMLMCEETVLALCAMDARPIFQNCFLHVLHNLRFTSLCSMLYIYRVLCDSDVHCDLCLRTCCSYNRHYTNSFLAWRL